MLRDLPAALALARPPVIVVVVPGPVASAVEVSGARRVTARRGDRSAPRLLVGGDVLDLAGPLVLDELQWADDLSLETIAGLARDLLDARRSGGPMVAVWRSGADRPALSELLLMAAGAGSVIEVIPDTVESLVDAGFEPAKAIELIAATGGLPELVAAAARSTTVDHEVAARLDLLDAETRWAADLLAFGGTVADGPGPALVVEGLVLPGAAARMPAAVARVVRAACPPDRRGSIAALVADHGDRCDRVALAGHLLALDDRSAVAVACYLEAAVEATGAAAIAFAGAARSGGGDEATCRRVAAGGLLDCNRPVEALRELAGLDEPDDHRTRGRAWAALGDPVAASVAFAAAGDEAWAEIAGIGAGIEPVRAIADDGSAAALAAVSLAAWSTGDFRRADEVIEPLTAATRRQRWLGGHREPVVIAELVVRVAERLGDHAAARATAADVDTMPEDTPHRPHLELVAGWIEARRGVLDHAGSDIVGESDVAPRWRLVREATRCAVAVRDTDGVGLDAATIAAAEAARTVAADLFDLDLRGDIAAAMERARADHLGDPLAPVAALAERGGTAPSLRRGLVSIAGGARRRSPRPHRRAGS